MEIIKSGDDSVSPLMFPRNERSECENKQKKNIQLQPLRAEEQITGSERQSYCLVDDECDGSASETAQDDDPDSAPKKSAMKKKWITGVLLCALGVALALLAHIILTLKLAAKAATHGYGWGSSSSVVYNGTCTKANQIATGLHVLINISVPTLTATSSYACQVLAAPSRAAIDKAHSQRVWVSIGSSSFTNIWYAPFWRKALWLLIFFTSLPVQMVYNSFIYVSFNANDYGIVLAPEEFVRGKSNISNFNVTSGFEGNVGQSPAGLLSEIQTGQLDGPDLDACVDIYNAPYQTSRSTFVALTSNSSTEVKSWSSRFVSVVSDASVNTSPDGQVGFSAPNPGIISPDLKRENYVLSVHTGDVMSDGIIVKEGFDYYNVTGCLSKSVPPTCQLGCSLPLGLVVLGCIGLKFLCLLIVAVERRGEIFLTVGDAIASFLRRPDPYSANNCLMARTNKGQPKMAFAFNDYAWISTFSRARPFRLGQLPSPQPKRICKDRLYWHAALPKRLFDSLLFLNFFAFAGGLTLLIMGSLGFIGGGTKVNTDGMSSVQKTITSWYNSQFHFLRYGGFIATVLLVNTPQAVISLMYAVYNNTLTRMLLASEYNDYGHERKSLRVSFPVGEQRSTYYLSIPYRYSVPFIMVSTLSHWLASEAMSYVKIIPRDVMGNLQLARSVEGLGTSSLGLGLMAIPWVVVAISILTLMYRKFKSASMPIAMNCSAAISAACHPPADDNEAAEKKVKWGQADTDIADLHTFQGPGIPQIVTRCRHCTFTSKEVVEPSTDVMYY